jgi:hypothetical protein
MNALWRRQTDDRAPRSGNKAVLKPLAWRSASFTHGLVPVDTQAAGDLLKNPIPDALRLTPIESDASWVCHLGAHPLGHCVYPGGNR